MEYKDFISQKEELEKKPFDQQKEFYLSVIEKEEGSTLVKLLAYFEYACLYYYRGDFRKAREVLEPLIIDYQSYEYVPKLISCLNFMGVCCQCEGEYKLSRYYYNLAHKLVNEHDEKRYISYEYNNIALTYIFEDNYLDALDYIILAEEYLAYSDDKMASCVYLNKADIYCYLNRLDEALDVYQLAIDKYNCSYHLPEDTLIIGLKIYFLRKDKEKYNKCLNSILNELDKMYASEFIDACNTTFQCALVEEDYHTIDILIKKMDDYMKKHRNENKVGLDFEKLKYQYAKKVQNETMALKAMEDKDYYYHQIISNMESQRVNAMDEYIDMQQHLHAAMSNEIRANQAKTRFLANMSHDIRTPMNAIVGIVNLMKYSIDNPKLMKEYLEKIDHSSKHMLELLNDLLDMSHIETEQIVVSKEPMQLIDLAYEIDNIISTQASEKGQTFNINFKNIKHNYLISDQLRLQRVLLNILNNSVKYTPSGGRIELTIIEKPYLSSTKANFEFVVEDTGFGMEKDVIDHIFDPFTRGTDSMINKIQGSGLGMSIAKSIIDAMGGQISISSHVNRGTLTKIDFSFDIDTITKKETILCAGFSKEEKTIIEDTIFFDELEFVEEVDNQTADLYLLKNKVKADLPNNSQIIYSDIGDHFSCLEFKKAIDALKNNKKEHDCSILNGMRFLCAEDNAINAEIMQALLKIKKADCDIFPDGKQLLEHFNLNASAYDTILLDIQMPVMNGYETAKAIRNADNPVGKTIPIIALSANAYDDDMKKAFEVGMNGYVSKPVNMDHLENIISKIFNKH